MHRRHASTALYRLLLVTLAASALLGCGGPATESGDDPQEIVSFHDEGLLGNALTRAEVKIVLKLIDDVCGDTWCEGDYNFRFRHLFCENGSGSCSLMFQMALRDGGTGSVPLWRWRMCRTNGFLGFDSLVSTTSGGYRWLAGAYYEELSACFAQLTQGGGTEE